MSINVEKLRRDLINYYGTATFNGMPNAMIEVIDIERASVEELAIFANQAGFDLEDYEEDLGR